MGSKPYSMNVYRAKRWNKISSGLTYWLTRTGSMEEGMGIDNYNSRKYTCLIPLLEYKISSEIGEKFKLSKIFFH